MKPIHVVSLFIGAVAIAAILWFVCRPREMEPIVIYKTAPIDTPRSAETAAARAATTAGGYADAHRALHQNGHASAPEPEMSVEERLEAAMKSPDYEAYTRKQAERVGFNIVLWWEFLEAAGITHNGRILQAAAFEKHFPDGGDYADYKPMMELEVAEMFLEDPDQSVMDVLQRFNATQSNRVWRFGYFNGYEGEYEWGQRIQRDAVDIVVNSIHPQEVPSPSVPETEGISRDAIETLHPSEESPHDTPVEIPSFTETETLPAAFEAQFFQGLETELPAFRTDAGLESDLRGQFSPERYGHAAETLRRYGPEEGLRRLKTSDPEVATEMERVLRRDTPKTN